MKTASATIALCLAVFIIMALVPTAYASLLTTSVRGNHGPSERASEERELDKKTNKKRSLKGKKTNEKSKSNKGSKKGSATVAPTAASDFVVEEPP
jgi:hypothetical protein